MVEERRGSRGRVQPWQRNSSSRWAEPIDTITDVTGAIESSTFGRGWGHFTEKEEPSSAMLTWASKLTMTLRLHIYLFYLCISLFFFSFCNNVKLQRLYFNGGFSRNICCLLISWILFVHTIDWMFTEWYFDSCSQRPDLRSPKYALFQRNFSETSWFKLEFNMNLPVV